MRIVFMGVPDFSVPALKRLIGSEYEIAAVYTGTDKPAGRGQNPTISPVKRVAQDHGLAILQPASLRDEAEIERLTKLKPDVIVVAAFGQMLPQEMLEIPQFGCLNIHPSLLPNYRGASPIASAILAGEVETGVTIMSMDAGMDSGPVLAQERVLIDPRDTSESLGTKLAEAGADLLMETLSLWFGHRLVPHPQGEEATYTKSISKTDGEIDWNLSATEIERRIRALYPWPGCYTHWQGKILKIQEAIALPSSGEEQPGVVMSMPLGSEAPVGVGTGEGILGLQRVQMEGKRIMSADEFLRGQKGFIGQQLV